MLRRNALEPIITNRKIVSPFSPQITSRSPWGHPWHPKRDVWEPWGARFPPLIWDPKRKQGPILTYRPLDDFGAPSEDSAGPENPTRTFYVSEGTFEPLLEPPFAPPKCSGAYKKPIEKWCRQFLTSSLRRAPGATLALLKAPLGAPETLHFELSTGPGRPN